MPAKGTGRKGCIVYRCDREHSSRGFCEYHYGHWLKQWLTDEGKKTKLWKGLENKERKNCKIKDCKKRPEKRGFCGKHYRWWQKGWCDKRGRVLKELKGIAYDKDATCRIPDCKEKPRRNGMCERHSARFQKGTITVDGSVTYTPKRKFNKDWPCVLCGKKGAEKYVLGFCKWCYDNRYYKGFVDFNGKSTGKKLKRVGKYKDTDTCIVHECQTKPRIRGFCEKHHDQFTRGNLNEKGCWTSKKVFKSKNKNLTCKVEDCDLPAHCRGLCHKHYWRLMNSGVAYKDWEDNPNWKNVGKTCSREDCDSPAFQLGLCSKHANRFKRGLPESDEDFYVNKGKRCKVEGCFKWAKTGGLCVKHNHRFKIGRPLKDKDFYINKGKECKESGCSRPAKARGLCTKHYGRILTAERKCVIFSSKEAQHEFHEPRS